MGQSITSIFGNQLRSTHDYVGWLDTFEGGEFSEMAFYEESSHWSEQYMSLIRQAHTILSLPMKEEYFVRPNQPLWSDPKEKQDRLKELRKNWTSMFKGEWEYLGGVKKGTDGKMKHTFSRKDKYCVVAFIEGETLQDFAAYYKKAGIELELNEEFKIQ